QWQRTSGTGRWYPIAEKRETRSGHDSPRESDTQTTSDVSTFSESRYWRGALMAERELDRIDRAILRLLAEDASRSLADIAARVGLTSTPCWKRIRRLDESGVIVRRVAVVDPEKVGLPLAAFVAVETADHSAAWLARFAAVVAEMPEIVGAWRMSGDVDYLLHVMVADITAFDGFYRRLIATLPLRNVTSRFAMEHMKSAPLPL
ncbi:MAG: Lrp/AsnC family transcriptional regulator, partial [Acetobacteraceae bacterium]